MINVLKTHIFSVYLQRFFVNLYNNGTLAGMLMCLTMGKTRSISIRKSTLWRFIVVLMLLCSPSIRAENRYPAICITTANLNLRDSGSMYGRVLETLPSGTKIQVERITNNGWAEIDYNGSRAYCYNKYLRYSEPVQPNTVNIMNKGSGSGSSGLWSWLFNIAIICIVLAILRKILITILGMVSMLFYRFYNLVSFPFYCLNWLQRRLAKPWIQYYKYNYRTDKKNAELREQYDLWKIPLYILLTPLRLLNAVYYNIVIHCSFEMFNYVVEVVMPEGEKEGADSFLLWLILIPWRFAKYIVWHGSLTFVESCLWTFIDAFIPALTVFHGTTRAAAEGICQGPGRVTSKNWLSAVWNVGGGNYAGNGIYFAPIKSTALHYASGSLIVCRVTFGRTLDLGMAPKRIYDLCGKPNALGVTEWGLKNGYVTGEWWRGDPRAKWWEYCMYDWQNRYNDSWRIRPLYVLNLDGECIQRIPGGMYHWLFNSMVIKDLVSFLEKKLG